MEKGSTRHCFGQEEPGREGADFWIMFFLAVLLLMMLFLIVFDDAVFDDAVVDDDVDAAAFDSVAVDDTVIDENRRYHLLVMGHVQGALAAESPGEHLQAY